MSEDLSDKPKEIFIEGIPASAGAVIGLAFIHQQKKAATISRRIEKDEIPLHLKHFDEARGKLIKQLNELRIKQSDETSKNILGSQIEIIRDPELSKRIKALIEKKQFGARRAIHKAFDEYIGLFKKSSTPLITDRLIDLTDVRDRLIEAADDKTMADIKRRGDIVVAEELSPREIIALSHQGIKGIVMERGGSSSHAAIIARSVGIPAVVGAAEATEMIPDQSQICLNGQQGLICVHPSSNTCTQIEKLREKNILNEKEEDELREHPSVTKDGHSFTLRANIEFPEELTHMQRRDAKGIGLLRTEAVYLNSAQFGSRQNQQLFYEDIIEKTGEQSVTIRLFDIGGDKFQNEKITESNPFLGWRGIRMLLDERELLREQLLAILGAAGKNTGRVKLLLPMITMISEIAEVKKEVEQCKQQLIEEGRPVDNDVPVGMMIETPVAAIQSEQFAKEVDFFSIGTNDLVQYLLAVDRGNARISKLYNQVHPVMWQMISKTVKAAHQQNIKVEVCGELASYPTAAACLLGMQIDGLSMNPSSILHVKKLLIAHTFAELETLAKKTLQCATLEEVEKLFLNWKNRK